MKGVPEDLSDLLLGMGPAALAFSGGCDSSYLLYASKACGADVRPYTVRGRFQPRFETADAISFSDSMGRPTTIIDVDVLTDPAIAANPPDRCYLCKRAVFGRISERAGADGRTVVMDATNASDDPGDRPGMRALAEMGVRSPLRECGLTKPEIRRLSKEAGLVTWDLPSNSCLATRIPTGTPITAEDLERTDAAEAELRDLGLCEIRVRLRGAGARLEVPEDELPLLDRLRPQVEAALLRRYSSVEYGTRVRR